MGSATQRGGETSKDEKSVGGGAIRLRWRQGHQCPKGWGWLGGEKEVKERLHFEPSSIFNLS